MTDHGERMEQLAIFENADDEAPGDFVSMALAAERVGHLLERNYAFEMEWPRLVEHKHHGRCLAWMQHRDPVKWVEGGYRYVLTDVRGFVVDESAWCKSRGGARGYLQRNTTGRWAGRI
jgi:hypothetical protein